MRCWLAAFQRGGQDPQPDQSKDHEIRKEQWRHWRRAGQDAADQGRTRLAEVGGQVEAEPEHANDRLHEQDALVLVKFPRRTAMVDEIVAQLAENKGPEPVIN